eukprot:1176591-Prorocentrum_minimum.AAC.2
MGQGGGGRFWLRGGLGGVSRKEDGGEGMEGERVSRKADFVPPISAAVSGGWKMPFKRSKTELHFTEEVRPPLDVHHLN